MVKFKSTASHREAIDHHYDVLVNHYNYSLSERICHYKTTGKSLSAVKQQQHIKTIRQDFDPDKKVHTHLFQDNTERLSSAFDRFFTRLKLKKLGKLKGKVGFPRFKQEGNYHSLYYKQPNNGYKLITNNKGFIYKIKLTNIGSIKTVKPFKLPDNAEVKIGILVSKPDGEYFHITFEYQEEPKVLPKKNVPIYPYSNIQYKPTKQADVGIDVGIKDFITMSNGDKINCPNLEKEFIQLKKLNSKLRHKCALLKKQGKDPLSSRRVLSLKRQIQRKHLKISRIRKDFINKVANFIVNSFGSIYIEDLDINGLIEKSFSKNHTRKIHQAGWGMLFKALIRRAEKADVVNVLKVLAMWTSQICSNCFGPAPKDLDQRIHICPCCNYKEDRDINAARNILLLGRNPAVLDEAKKILSSRKASRTGSQSKSSDSPGLSE